MLFLIVGNHYYYYYGLLGQEMGTAKQISLLFHEVLWWKRYTLCCCFHRDASWLCFGLIWLIVVLKNVIPQLTLCKIFAKGNYDFQSVFDECKLLRREVNRINKESFSHYEGCRVYGAISICFVDQVVLNGWLTSRLYGAILMICRPSGAQWVMWPVALWCCPHVL